MSSVPKLGNNRYLATSKGVNRMLNQLNGILAADNITVQNVTATGGTATTTISLASGNFIKVTIAASSTTTLAFTDKSPGLYYLLITNSATGPTTAPVLSGTIKGSSPTAFPTTADAVSIVTMICDGTNIYELTRSVSIT
jgi:hypothetical protein